MIKGFTEGHLGKHFSYWGYFFPDECFNRDCDLFITSYFYGRTTEMKGFNITVPEWKNIGPYISEKSFSGLFVVVKRFFLIIKAQFCSVTYWTLDKSYCFNVFFTINVDYINWGWVNCVYSMIKVKLFWNILKSNLCDVIMYIMLSWKRNLKAKYVMIN